MSSLILSQQQKDVLRKYAKEFVTWIDTEKGRHASLIHRDHERYFKETIIRKSSENDRRLVVRTITKNCGQAICGKQGLVY